MHWINSLGIKDVMVSNLIDDLRSGRVLLRIIDRLRPGSVDWEKRYTNKLNSRIHVVQNCNYAIELCQEKLGIKIVNIGGVDIVDGKVNLVLGLVWQLCKVYWEERVGHIQEDKLISWANHYVPEHLRIHTL